MWAHRLTQTLGLCPQGNTSDHLSILAPCRKSLSLTHTRILLGANGVLTQVQPKSRSVGLPSEANSHLPESELRGARRPLPTRGKREKLINPEKVREQKMASDSEGSMSSRIFFAWIIGGRALAVCLEDNVSRLCLCGCWSTCYSVDIEISLVSSDRQNN